MKILLESRRLVLLLGLSGRIGELRAEFSVSEAHLKAKIDSLGPV